MAIELTNVNDAPSSTDDVVSTDEDIAKVLGSSDFGTYSDEESSSLAAVKIITLPSHGLLEYNQGTVAAPNWVVVVENQEVSATDLDAGKLRFTPSRHESGDNYAGIAFEVGDGERFSADTYTLNVNVTPIADKPILSAEATNSGKEGEFIKLKDISASFDDQDGSEVHTLTLDNLPVGAILSDGVNVFVASAGNTSADILGWDYSNLQMKVSISNLSETFTLTLSGNAVEQGNNDSEESSIPITVEVTGAQIIATNNSYTVQEDGSVSGNIVTDGTADSDTHPSAGQVKAGAILEYRVQDDTDGNSQWENTGSGTAKSGDMDWDLVGVTREAVTSKFEGINHAYRFDGSSSSAKAQSPHDMSTDPTQGDATLEVWFKADGSVPADQYMFLYETGGAADGTAILLQGTKLYFVVEDTTPPVSTQVALSYDLAELGIDPTTEFVQLTAVADFGPNGSPGELRLYVNGSLVAQDATPANLRDWTGGDDAGLGGAYDVDTATDDPIFINGEPLAVDGSGNPANIVVAPFKGHVSEFRLYSEALSHSDVLGNFAAVAGLAVTHVNGQPVNALNPIDTGNGALLIAADGSYLFTPDPDFFGTESFTYTLSDADGHTDTAIVTIKVVSEPDLPEASDNQYTLLEGALLTGHLVNDDTGDGRDTDGDGETLSITAINGINLVFDTSDKAIVDIEQGLLTVSNDGSFSFQHDGTDPSGSLTFTYTVSDGNSGSFDDATVTLDVTPVNDPPVVSGADGAVVVSPATDKMFTGPSYPSSPTSGAQHANGVSPSQLSLSGPSQMTAQFISESAGFSNVIGWYVVDGDNNDRITQTTPIWYDSNFAKEEQKLVIPNLSEGEIGFFLVQNGLNNTADSPYLKKVDQGIGFVRFEKSAHAGTLKAELAVTSDTDVKLVYYASGTELNPQGNGVVLTAPVVHASYSNLATDGATHVRSGINNGDDSELIIGFEDLLTTDRPDWDLEDFVFRVSIQGYSTSPLASKLEITDDGNIIAEATVAIRLAQKGDLLLLDNTAKNLASSNGIHVEYDNKNSAIHFSGDAELSVYKQLLNSVGIGNLNPLGTNPREISYAVVDVGTLTSNTKLVSFNPDVNYDMSADDLVIGTDGNDLLVSGAGSDVLIGGQGDDVLTGGSGNDTFQFNLSDLIVSGTAQLDEITDFTVAGLDADGRDFLDISNLIELTDSQIYEEVNGLPNLNDVDEAGLLAALKAGGMSAQVDTGANTTTLVFDNGTEQTLKVKLTGVSDWDNHGSDTDDVLMQLIANGQIIV
ncbi:Ig-like domain-containing protein [Sansalvadorimonas verongulae]|uniref:Ig-like domain-containing protein n=1 Tax=Sansalvadorimonas verongulae TaxID=2172824 RepID=UPI0012BC9542|nr:Ig-like domain-containing protein [Sansalvadorimonas verongulae]MTI14800.1 hypothetical protein [Sansalvadorimonas verongulae]